MRATSAIAAGLVVTMTLSGFVPQLLAGGPIANPGQLPVTQMPVSQYPAQYQQPAQYQVQPAQYQYPAQYQQGFRYPQTQYAYPTQQPAQYQYPAQYQQGYQQQYQYPQYYQQGYYQQQQYPGPTAKLDSAGESRLGRTLGGAAGIAAGSFGGAMLASAVIKAAGIAALGPVAPILVGTAITAGGAFIGAKGLSALGQAGDRLLGPGTAWTLVGGIGGAIAGFTLLPALGPLAGPAGRVIGAALGGIIGGTVAKLLAPKLDKVGTPAGIYGATGALLGGVGFGPIGALAGAAGGYALGSIFDKNFFADRNGSLRSNYEDARDHVYDLRDKVGDWKDTVSDWFHNRTDRFRDRMSMRWNYYDHDSGYYDDYADSSQFVNQYTGWGQRGYGIGYQNYSSESGFNGGLSDAKARYYRALEEFQRVNASGTPAQRADAAKRVHEAQVNFTRAKQSGF